MSGLFDVIDDPPVQIPCHLDGFYCVWFLCKFCKLGFCNFMFSQKIRQRDFLFCGFGLVTLSICMKLWLYVIISSCQISSLRRFLLCLFWLLGVHANNLHFQSSVFGFL